ncbi:MAG: phage tail tape measure protein [Clostridia bacterium]|nr:phage tail tape measure protein [Clostridia bacterium]
MAVDLLTNVIIGGQTTSGFNALAGRLTTLGATVEKIGSYVREFEKDSVQVYRNYEDNMLAAEYALSAQYSSATELSTVMQNLDLYASQWAASTIFHTSDVSAAINEAAHAGWNYEQIVKGIPQAMYIAQAGGMELSTGLDYLVKMMGATSTEFGEMGTVIDQWSKAANLSATDIGEMGQAFMSLGAAAQFGDSTQELFTMLAVLANVGTTGSQAGTALRGAMMRIIAPTTKAENAMSLLGADADELNEVLADENVTKAAKTLEGLGFSAYDTQGNLLPMIDIFTNLHTALQGLSEQSQNEILAAIFPTRNIASAKAFMQAVGNGQMAHLFESIGDSEGYAAKGADIMMSGLTGAIETLASKWEEFQRQVGETLAPAIENVAGWLGTIMDAVNNMDESTLNGLVTALTAIAAAGPGLLIAGGAIKFFGTLGPVGSAMLLIGVGAAFLAGKLAALNEINFKSNFGTMELDLDELGSHVDSLKTSFDNQLTTISEWETALAGAEEKYATTSSKFAETLLTDVLTGKKLTPQEIANINQYAQDLYDAVWTGIENAEASDMTFLDAIFGDHESVEQENVGNTAAQVVTSWYESLYGEARAVGEELRNQMTAALQDGSLNEAERQAIQASVDRYNQIMAEIQSQMDAEAYYEQLYKAQSVSWDSISAYIEENTTKQESDLAALEDAYAAKWAHYRAAFDYAIANGTEFTDFEGNTRKVTEGDWTDFEAQFQLEKERAIQGVYDKYGDLSAAAFDALMNDSDYGDAWKLMRMASFNEDGSLNVGDMFAGMNREELDAANSALSDLWTNAHSILKRLPNGFFDTEQGEYMSSLMAAAGNAANAASQWNTDLWMAGWDTVPTQAQLPLMLQLAQRQSDLEALSYKQQQLEQEISTRQTRLDNNDYSAWQKTFGPYIADDRTALYGNLELPQIRAGQYTEGSLYGQQEQVNLDIAAAEADIAALQSQLDALSAPGPLDVTTTLNTSAVDNYTPPTKYMPVVARPTMTPYAEGGRAVTASIFGEAGPEWAIPEAHTERTAELLNAAREASGFSWGDLLGRFGGLNANPNRENVVVHYSPTINAADARGVADVLAADKARLIKLVKDMLADQRLRDEVEVYA